MCLRYKDGIALRVTSIFKLKNLIGVRQVVFSGVLQSNGVDGPKFLLSFTMEKLLYERVTGLNYSIGGGNLEIQQIYHKPFDTWCAV